MKKLLILSLSFIFASSAFAQDKKIIACKTPYGQKVELIRIEIADKDKKVFFDNKLMPNFQCFDRTSSESFTGVIRCYDSKGKYLVEITNLTDEYHNGFMMKGKSDAKISLRCGEY